MVRRCAAVLAAGVLLSACGSEDPAPRSAAVVAAASATAAPGAGGTAGPAVPGAIAPAVVTVAPRPAGSRSGAPEATGAGAPSRTRTATPAPSTRRGIDVTLVARGDPLLGGGKIVQAMDQVGCGEDDEGVTIHIDVDGTDRVKNVWFTYRVSTRTPFSGEQHDLTASGDLHRYHGVIGPFEAKPGNAAGGTITVVAHVVEGNGLEGRERTGRGTFTLRPCR
jgi:hypothetical protein